MFSFHSRYVVGILVLGFSLLALPRLGHPQAFCPSHSEGWQPVAYQELTLDAVTPRGLDISALATLPHGIAMALVSVEGATIRFVWITTTPTPSGTIGHELAPGERFFLCGRAMIESWRGIRTSQGSGNATVRVTLFQPS